VFFVLWRLEMQFRCAGALNTFSCLVVSFSNHVFLRTTSGSRPCVLAHFCFMSRHLACARIAWEGRQPFPPFPVHSHVFSLTSSSFGVFKSPALSRLRAELTQAKLFLLLFSDFVLGFGVFDAVQTKREKRHMILRHSLFSFNFLVRFPSVCALISV